MMICPNCKTENADYTQYCVNCGHKFEGAKIVETAASKTIFILSCVSLIFPLISLNNIVIFIGFGFAFLIFISAIGLKLKKIKFKYLNLSIAFSLSVIIMQTIWYLYFQFIFPYL